MFKYMTLLVLFVAAFVSPALAVDTLDVKATVKGPWATFSSSGLPGEGHALYVAKDGSIWWGIEDGAVCFDGTTWTKYAAQDGLMDGAVRGIVQANDGTFWFSGSHKGKAAATRYDGTIWQIYTEEDAMIGSWLGVAIVDSMGHFWSGTQRTFTVRVPVVYQEA